MMIDCTQLHVCMEVCKVVLLTLRLRTLVHS